MVRPRTGAPASRPAQRLPTTTPARYDSPTASRVRASADRQPVRTAARGRRRLGAGPLGSDQRLAATRIGRRTATQTRTAVSPGADRRPADDARCNRRHPRATAGCGAATGGRKLERAAGPLHAGGRCGRDVRRVVAVPRTSRIDAADGCRTSRPPGGIRATTWRSTSSRTSGRNTLLAASGARQRRGGFVSGGGGGFLTDTARLRPEHPLGRERATPGGPPAAARPVSTDRRL